MRLLSGMLLLLTVFPSAVLAEAVLQVEITCIDSAEGKIRIALFDSRATHLKTSVRDKVLSATKPRVVWRVPNLSPGEYSLAVYHDRNDNGRHDRNFLGLPKEPYGFSHGLRARFGPPSWKSARFLVSEPAAKVSTCVK